MGLLGPHSPNVLEVDRFPQVQRQARCLGQNVCLCTMCVEGS